MNWNVADQLRLWLRAGMAGCEFAKRLSSKSNRVAIEVHLDPEFPPTEWLNNTFDAHAEADRAVIAAFPRITSELGLVDLLNTLARERWRVRIRKKTSPNGGVLVGVDWVTKTGDVSETMGVSPSPWMPVSRRGRMSRSRPGRQESQSVSRHWLHASRKIGSRFIP